MKVYSESYKEDLVKDMPRIPLLAHFPEYVRIGRALAELHLNYEKPVNAEELGIMVEMRRADYTVVDKMRFGKGKDKSTIEYNPYITLLFATFQRRHITTSSMVSRQLSGLWNSMPLQPIRPATLSMTRTLMQEASTFLIF